MSDVVSMKRARAIKEKYSDRLLGLPGVWGVGVEVDESGQPVLIVHTDRSHPDSYSEVPAELEGCRVKLVEDGPFFKQHPA